MDRSLNVWVGKRRILAPNLIEIVSPFQHLQDQNDGYASTLNGWSAAHNLRIDVNPWVFLKKFFLP